MCVCFNKNGIILYMSFYNFLFKRLVCHWHISLSFCAGLWGWLWASLLGKPKAELKVFPLAFGGSFDSLRSGEVALYTGKEHSSFIASCSSIWGEFGEQTPLDSWPFLPFSFMAPSDPSLNLWTFLGKLHYSGCSWGRLDYNLDSIALMSSHCKGWNEVWKKYLK